MLVRNAYHSLEKLTILSLFDVLDATNDQVVKFEDTIGCLLVAYKNKDIDIKTMEYLVSEWVDVVGTVMNLPYRHKMTLARVKNIRNAHEALVVREAVNGAFESWFTMSLWSMHEVGWDADQMGKVVDKVLRDVCDYADGWMTDKDIDSTFEVLEEENGYLSKAAREYDI